MKTNYVTSIKESEEELVQMSQGARLCKERDYVNFLLYLKTGQATSQGSAAKLVNRSARQGQRMWHYYKTEGIDFLSHTHCNGYQGRMSEFQKFSLQFELLTDQVASQKEAITVIKDKFNISYTQGAISYIFKTLHIKLKTGRPVSVNQDTHAMDELKKIP